MSEGRIKSYKQFSNYIEYPMVMFEAGTGAIIHMNYEASVVFGKQIERLFIEPRNTIVYTDFWDILHKKKSLIWHRIRLIADEKEYAVSGFVNEIEENGVRIYTVLFESKMQLGSFLLERVLGHACVTYLYLSNRGNEKRIEYVSESVKAFGYTNSQIYDKSIDIFQVVCEEDRERIQQCITQGIENHCAEVVVECNIITEARELAPVRILTNFVYSEIGNLDAMELLVFDLRENLYHKKANDYLNHAISKMKSVVLIKNYRQGERSLKYVSPNAGMVGMNVDALNNGLKLTEDYIHPGDRERVIASIYQAMENGITDFKQTYRMVTDEGKQIWVLNELTIHRKNEQGTQISFLLTDVTEQIMMEQKLADIREELDVNLEQEEKLVRPILDISNPSTRKFLYDMSEALNAKGDYYNLVLQEHGGMLIKPIGPMENIGLIYDVLERPSFREEFQNVTMRAKEQMITVQWVYQLEQLSLYIAVSPIVVDEKVRAYWVVADFKENNVDKLVDLATTQVRFAEAILKSIYLEEENKKMKHLRSISQSRLQKSKKGRELFGALFTEMLSESDVSLSEMCQKIGIYVNASQIAIFVENKEHENAEKYFVWSCTNEESDFFESMNRQMLQYRKLNQLFEERKPVIIQGEDLKMYIRDASKRNEVDSMLVCPMYMRDSRKGYIVFVRNEQIHRFREEDLEYANMITFMFTELIFGREYGQTKKISMENCFQTYQHLREAIFVKDHHTKKIIFANKTMKKLYGRNVVGLNASEILEDRFETYPFLESMQSMKKEENESRKWQSYVKTLDRVMNIEEIKLQEATGEYSVVILKKPRDKKNTDKLKR